MHAEFNHTHVVFQAGLLNHIAPESNGALRSFCGKTIDADLRWAAIHGQKTWELFKSSKCASCDKHWKRLLDMGAEVSLKS